MSEVLSVNVIEQIQQQLQMAIIDRDVTSEFCNELLQSTKNLRIQIKLLMTEKDLLEAQIRQHAETISKLKEELATCIIDSSTIVATPIEQSDAA